MNQHHDLIDNGCTRLPLTSDPVAILSSETLREAVMLRERVA